MVWCLWRGISDTLHSRNAEGGSRKTGRPRKPRLVCVWRVEGARGIKIIFKNHIVVAMNT